MTLLLALVIPFGGRIIPIIIALIILSTIFEFNYIKKFSIRYFKNVFSLIGFYLLYIIGMIYSENFYFGLKDLEIKLSLLIFPLIFAIANDKIKNGKNMIMLFFVLGSLACSLLYWGNAIYNWLVGDCYYCFYYSRFSILQHPTYSSVYLVISMIIGFDYLQINKHRFRPGIILLLIFALLFLACTVYFLSAKAVIVSLFLILIVYLVRIILNIKNVYIKILIPVVVISVGIYTFSSNYRFKQLYRFEKVDPESKSSTAVRIIVWKSALDLIWENWIFGVGTGDMKDKLIEHYEENGYLGALERKLNAHNQYFEVFLALGILGISLFFYIIFSSFVIGVKRKDLIIVLFAVLLGINFFFESMLDRQAGVVFFAFFYCILLLKENNTESNENSDNFRSKATVY